MQSSESALPGFSGALLMIHLLQELKISVHPHPVSSVSLG
jgi:hypothetical protein